MQKQKKVNLFSVIVEEENALSKEVDRQNKRIIHLEKTEKSNEIVQKRNNAIHQQHINRIKESIAENKKIDAERLEINAKISEAKKLQEKISELFTVEEQQRKMFVQQIERQKKILEDKKKILEREIQDLAQKQTEYKTYVSSHPVQPTPVVVQPKSTPQPQGKTTPFILEQGKRRHTLSAMRYRFMNSFLGL